MLISYKETRILIIRIGDVRLGTYLPLVGQKRYDVDLYSVGEDDGKDGSYSNFEGSIDVLDS